MHRPYLCTPATPVLAKVRSLLATRCEDPWSAEIGPCSAAARLVPLRWSRAGRQQRRQDQLHRHCHRATGERVGASADRRGSVPLAFFYRLRCSTLPGAVLNGTECCTWVPIAPERLPRQRMLPRCTAPSWFVLPAPGCSGLLRSVRAPFTAITWQVGTPITPVAFHSLSALVFTRPSLCRLHSDQQAGATTSSEGPSSWPL